jgi:hypothetical protein
LIKVNSVNGQLAQKMEKCVPWGCPRALEPYLKVARSPIASPSSVEKQCEY